MAKAARPMKKTPVTRQRPVASDPHDANPAEGDSGPFPIVGIGMSAGGLEAATEFLNAMPPDSGMGFVIVQHLEPTRKSLLAELLGKQTKMPVVEIEDGMRVEPDHVYVIAPAQTLLIEDGALRLSEPAEPRGQRHPIDRFFTALAEDRKTRAIAIVLTGAGSNGTAGIQDIKLAGGMCIAQDPETAKFDSMPSHAIASGAADYVLAPAEMPAALIRYVNHPYIDGDDRPEPLAREPEAEFGEVLTLLLARGGHDFRQYKRSTLTRRTHRRMGLAGIESLDDYLTRLRQDPAELTALARDLMINVTGFFRDPEAWDALDRDVIGSLVEKASRDQPIRAWAPACSTGEESYTIAMLLAERAERAEKKLAFKIFATDLADNNLAAARKGIYPASMVESLSPERLERFFDKAGETYRVKPEIRESVVFAEQNLLTDPPYSKMDLVSCRNLLIYLDAEAQERVLSLAHFALKEGGYLFLGNAESVGQRGHLFETVSKRWRIYRRIGPARPAAVDFPTWPRPDEPARGPAAPKLADLATRALAERFAPASVVIDRHYRIHHFHGATEEYLAQPAGPPTFDLTAMARGGLGLTIRRAVKKAIESGGTANVAAARAPNGLVEIAVSPLGSGGNGDGLLLVSFAMSRKARAAPRKRERGSRIPEQDLDDELKEARDELQAVAEEYETANEELKAANEEAISVNEELQATNEELESSKEELQSLNEELNAVNAQLERKVAELEEVGDDLRNLLAGNEIATIFLDTRLRVKWFTPAMTSLFDLIDADIGRPIANLAQKFADGDLSGKAKAAIERLATVEEEVLAENGRCFLLRVQPYRTRDNRIAGAVASFVDISELRATRARIAAARDYAEAIVETVRDPLLVLDADLNVVSANPAFYEMFRIGPTELVGHKFFEARGRQWDTPRLRELLEEMLPVQGRITDFEVRHDFPGIGERIMLNNARRIPGAGDRPDLILLAKEDITERRGAEQHQDMLVGELSHRVKNTLAVVQSLATQTLRNSETLDSFGDAFLGRIEALGRAHDMVLKGGFRDIALDDIVAQALKPFQSNGRIEIGGGPAVELGRARSQALTMVLHELATNAVKYGALSAAKGKIAIDWRVDGNDGARRVAIAWRESGGPAVRAPEREGQGTRFIEKGVAYELRGRATLDFQPKGLRATIDFPLPAREDEREPPPPDKRSGD
jgi:two-component system CheB/CheR fusion protein